MTLLVSASYAAYLLGSMRLTYKKRYFHTNFVHYFGAVNYRTKKTKKTKQSAFHTDLVN